MRKVGDEAFKNVIFLYIFFRAEFGIHQIPSGPREVGGDSAHGNPDRYAITDGHLSHFFSFRGDLM